MQFTVDTIKANGLKDGYVRLVVTRGTGGLGLNPYLCERPSMFIIASTISLYPEEYYTNGLAIVTCATRRPAPAALMPQLMPAAGRCCMKRSMVGRRPSRSPAIPSRYDFAIGLPLS